MKLTTGCHCKLHQDCLEAASVGHLKIGAWSASIRLEVRRLQAQLVCQQPLLQHQAGGHPANSALSFADIQDTPLEKIRAHHRHRKIGSSWLASAVLMGEVARTE